MILDFFKLTYSKKSHCKIGFYNPEAFVSDSKRLTFGIIGVLCNAAMKPKV